MATETDVAVAAGEVAEHGGGMPQLDGSTWASQIFWTAVALFVLHRILTRTVLPKIGGALEDRHNAIADDLDRAAELKQRAEDAKATYQQGLADARSEANRIAAKNQAEIDAELAQAEAEAEAEIAARTAESEERIDAIRAEAEGQARDIATEAARAIVEKFAPGAVDDARLKAAVDDALAAQDLPGKAAA